MNKNTFMSPLRGLALASVATAVLSSCAKDEFTERQALSLELQKLRAQREVDSLARVQQRIYDINTLRYQRALDSLDRINAGGRVFYSVTVVSGSSTAFAGGRSEEVEGVAGATVSISQYGAVTTVTTPASGLATAELRSGAANVVITAPNHTTANYVVNLTPDGSTQIGTPGNVTRNAPGNGTTVYVGNVVPLFQTGGPNAASQMATIRGRAFIETNLTNITPEVVTPALLGTGSNLVTVNINTQSPLFATRYLNNRLNASSIDARGTGWEGDIQRIAYEDATRPAPVQPNGDYSVLAPATASGLPLRMVFSEIATDRTFWRTIDGEERAVIRRANYGPDHVATGVEGNIGRPRLTFTAFERAANITAAYTAPTTPTSGPVMRDNRGAVGTAPNNRVWVAGVDSLNRGIYLTAPTLAITGGGGTGAAGTVSINRPTFAAADFAAPFNRANQVNIDPAGTGYTSNPTATLTRTDITQFGTGTIAGAGTTGTSLASYIRITNGGFGFVTTGATTVTRSGAYTNLPPRVLFNQTANTPFAPGVITTPAVVAAGVGGGVVIDGTVGAIQNIILAPGNTGAGYPAVPVIDFNYGDALSLPGADAQATPEDLFRSNGPNQGLQFNAAYSFPAGITFSSPTQLNFANTVSQRYTFVPFAVLAPNDNARVGGTVVTGIVPSPTRQATFQVTVNSDATSAFVGAITSIIITDGGQGVHNNGAATTVDSDFLAPIQQVGLNIQPNNIGNTLAATAFLAASGSINNYVVTNNTPNLAGLGSAITQDPTVTTFNPAVATQVRTAVIGSDLLAAFDAPTGTGVGRAAAWGIPVVTSLGQIEGVRIVSGGVGYTAAQSTAGIGMYLIPNPFFTAARFDNADNGLAAVVSPTYATLLPAPITVANGIAQNLLALFNTPGTFVNARVSVRVNIATVPGFITFTVVDGGAGYAQVPTVALSASQTTFDSLSQMLAGATVTGSDPAIPALGAAGSTQINRAALQVNNSSIVRVGGAFPGAAANQGRITLSGAGAGLTVNPGTLSVFAIDQLSQALTSEFRAAQTATTPQVTVLVGSPSFPNTGAGGTVGGTILGVFNGNVANIGGAGTGQPGSNPNALDRSERLDLLAARAGWPALDYNRIPRVTVSAPPSNIGGTPVTATAVIPPIVGNTELDGLRLVGNGLYKIQRIQITNGGAGYSNGNYFFGSPLNGNFLLNFYVIGNPGQDTFTLGEFGHHLFNAFSGVTYVRDVNYGTGAEVR